ncbi:GIY-YIG nuclease family protein [Corynebacterium gallinarum]|uniref:GIY-YIG nuclease family protein n=1 Tax=Corynebacterium gallinarum TaxID=2762214 RepID=A0A8I0LHD1_9CORY|nr:GIY-YIG nuclease family protein [Corynebacterium gallinarum]MBD8030590.1 GIY-YIG nuclease family protein [Corynebacterium gallinarum]
MNPAKPTKAPKKSTLSAGDVKRFRSLLEKFLNSADPQGRVIGAATWGVYAFYDFDGEPIYVGQTKESLRGRVRRHLTNQRTDAVAMRVLDVLEVAEVEVWPLWDLQVLGRIDKPTAQKRLDEYEYSAYLKAIDKSKFRAILNEKIPPRNPRVDLPESFRGSVISVEDYEHLSHPDIRIARRAETISRLADVVRERGEVSTGLRRVLVIQAIRLTFLSAERLAFSEGRPQPSPLSIDSMSLVGSVLSEKDSESYELEQEECED